MPKFVVSLFAFLMLGLWAPAVAQGSSAPQAETGISREALIGRWRSPARSMPMHEITIRFAESVGEYRADGSMRADCNLTFSGVVDGVDIPEAATRMRIELTGTWELQERTLVHRITGAVVTPVTDEPELREFAALVKSMYEQFPTVTAQILSWDGRTLWTRDEISGEKFEMTRIG